MKATKVYSEYRGCTIERTFPSGYFVSTIRNYNSGQTVRADTLAGLKALIRETLAEFHLTESC